jgi:hypothetical protein
VIRFFPFLKTFDGRPLFRNTKKSKREQQRFSSVDENSSISQQNEDEDKDEDEDASERNEEQHDSSTAYRKKISNKKKEFESVVVKTDKNNNTSNKRSLKRHFEQREEKEASSHSSTLKKSKKLTPDLRKQKHSLSLSTHHTTMSHSTTSSTQNTATAGVIAPLSTTVNKHRSDLSLPQKRIKVMADEFLIEEEPECNEESEVGTKSEEANTPHESGIRRVHIHRPQHYTPSFNVNELLRNDPSNQRLNWNIIKNSE